MGISVCLFFPPRTIEAAVLVGDRGVLYRPAPVCVCVCVYVCVCAWLGGRPRVCVRGFFLSQEMMTRGRAVSVRGYRCLRIEEMMPHARERERKREREMCEKEKEVEREKERAVRRVSSFERRRSGARYLSSLSVKTPPLVSVSLSRRRAARSCYRARRCKGRPGCAPSGAPCSRRCLRPFREYLTRRRAWPIRKE